MSEEPYFGVPFHWKTHKPIKCKIRLDGVEDRKFADCPNCQNSRSCNYAYNVQLAGIIGKIEDQVKRPDKVERKTMKVKGGEAWVETRTFASTREVATVFLAMCSDGVIREVVRFYKSNGCPEGH